MGKRRLGYLARERRDLAAPVTERTSEAMHRHTVGLHAAEDHLHCHPAQRLARPLARENVFASPRRIELLENCQRPARQWYAVLAAAFHPRCRHRPDFPSEVDFIPPRAKHLAATRRRQDREFERQRRHRFTLRKRARIAARRQTALPRDGRASAFDVWAVACPSARASAPDWLRAARSARAPAPRRAPSRSGPRTRDAVSGMLAHSGCRTSSTAAVSISSTGTERSGAQYRCSVISHWARCLALRHSDCLADRKSSATCPNVGRPALASRAPSIGFCPATSIRRASAARSRAAASDTPAPPRPISCERPRRMNRNTHFRPPSRRRSGAALGRPHVRPALPSRLFAPSAVPCPPPVCPQIGPQISGGFGRPQADNYGRMIG